MHTAVCLNVDGSFKVMRLNHDDISYYMKGTISIVGAIDDAQAIAVARQYSDECVNTTCARYCEYFDSNIKGPVLLVGSDEDGQACDLDTDHVLKALHLIDSDAPCNLDDAVVPPTF